MAFFHFSLWFFFFLWIIGFLAMNFIFYAVENGHKFSEPKMNGKITLSIFGMENDLVLFWYLRVLFLYLRALNK